MAIRMRVQSADTSVQHSGEGRATPRKLSARKPGVDIRELRGNFGLTRRDFSRATGYSERAIAEWEGNKPLSDASRTKMLEMDRLQKALARVMQAAFIGEWMMQPNEAFDGFKPLELVERGEVDRLWRMIFELESGVPN